MINPDQPMDNVKIQAVEALIEAGKIDAIWFEFSGIGAYIENNLLEILKKLVKNKGISQSGATGLQLKVPFPGDVVRVEVKDAAFVQLLELSIREEKEKE
jgi:hypothetical protein